LFVEIPIVFIVPLKDASIFEKESVTLHVEVNKPGVVLTWLKDGTELTPGERIEVSVEGTVHQLHIKSAVLEDAGVYMVTVGVIVSKANLEVKGENMDVFPWLLHCKTHRISKYMSRFS